MPVPSDGRTPPINAFMVVSNWLPLVLKVTRVHGNCLGKSQRNHTERQLGRPTCGSSTAPRWSSSTPISGVAPRLVASSATKGRAGNSIGLAQLSLGGPGTVFTGGGAGLIVPPRPPPPFFVLPGPLVPAPRPVPPLLFGRVGCVFTPPPS